MKYSMSPRHWAYAILIVISTLIIIVMATGCTSERHFQKTASAHPDWLQHKDSTSTVIKYIPHDTTITIKGNDIYHDSIIKVSGPCPQVIRTSHNTGSAITLIQQHDTIFLKCKCDSLQAVIQTLMKEITTLHQRTIIIPPKQPSRWEVIWGKWCDIWGWIAVLALIGLAIWKLGPATVKFLTKIPWPF